MKTNVLMKNDELADAELENVTGGDAMLLFIAAAAGITYLAESLVEAKQSGTAPTIGHTSTNVGKGQV